MLMLLQNITRNLCIPDTSRLEGRAISYLFFTHVDIKMKEV